MKILKTLIIIVSLGALTTSVYARTGTQENLLTGGVFSGCYAQSFVVTAYYSPLKGQPIYAKGSYEEDVILNGSGTHGASGKPVYDGMIAAPAGYPFGTKIVMPGRGIGTVHDRGGAIVHSGERGQSADRLDLRMGQGLVALIKALSFGKQQVNGYICLPGTKLPTNAEGIDPARIPYYQAFFDRTLWFKSFDGGEQDARVRTLQSYLIKLNFLAKADQNGIYDPRTKKAVCQYQQQRLFMSRTSPRCGTFGPMTSAALKAETKLKGIRPANYDQMGTLRGILEQIAVIQDKIAYRK